tara:strand:+ start:3152 stop:3553 length:402 start_codon:yes stop_codon:yes gene_type:complete
MQQNKWFIPGNVPSSKNSRRWTGKYFIASKTVMKYRKDTAKYYKKFTESFQEEVAKYKAPVFVHFTFIRGTKHKFDYINPAQTVQDDMVKHGWMEDDNCEFIVPCFNAYKYDKNNPGVIIEINEKFNERRDDT